MTSSIVPWEPFQLCRTPMSAGFTPNEIRLALVCSLAAYGGSSMLQARILSKHPDVVSFATSPCGAPQAYLIALTSNSVFIAMRGTTDLKDWFSSVQLDGVSKFEGALHRGFEARAKCVPVDSLLAQEDVAHRKVFFVGHSLGGAVAQVCTLLALQSHPDKWGEISCISFGTPFVATLGVQKFLSRKKGDLLLEDRFLTIVNQQDCVPGILNATVAVSAAEQKIELIRGKLEQVSKVLQPAFQFWSLFATWYPGVANWATLAGFAATTTKAALAALQLKEWQAGIVKALPEYRPIGKYQFIEVVISDEGREAVQLSKIMGHGEYEAIYERLAVAALEPVNIEHHALWNYWGNWCNLAPFSTTEDNKRVHPVIQLGPTTDVFGRRLLSERLFRTSWPTLTADHRAAIIWRVGPLAYPACSSHTVLLRNVAFEQRQKVCQELIRGRGATAVVYWYGRAGGAETTFYDKVLEALHRGSTVTEAVTLGNEAAADLTVEFELPQSNTTVKVPVFALGDWKLGDDVREVKEDELNRMWEDRICGLYLFKKPTRVIPVGKGILVDGVELAARKILRILKRNIRRIRQKKRYEEIVQETTGELVRVHVSTTAPAVVVAGTHRTGDNMRTMDQIRLEAKQTIDDWIGALHAMQLTELKNMNNSHQEIASELRQKHSLQTTKLIESYATKKLELRQTLFQEQNHMNKQFLDQHQKLMQDYGIQHETMHAKFEAAQHEYEKQLAALPRSIAKRICDTHADHQVQGQSKWSIWDPEIPEFETACGELQAKLNEITQDGDAQAKILLQTQSEKAAEYAQARKALMKNQSLQMAIQREGELKQLQALTEKGIEEHADLAMEQLRAQNELNEKQNLELRQLKQVHCESERVMDLEAKKAYREQLRGARVTQTRDAAILGMKYGAMSGCLGGVIVNGVAYAQGKKTGREATAGIMAATAWGAGMGAATGAAVAFAETTSLILAESSATTDQILCKVLGGLCKHAGMTLMLSMLSFQSCKILWDYCNGKTTSSVCKARLAGVTAQMGFGAAGSMALGVAVGTIANPFLTLTVGVLGSLGGGFLGSKLAEWLDANVFKSHLEALRAAYKVLGASEDEHDTVISRKFYAIARNTHPDKTQDLPEALRATRTLEFEKAQTSLEIIRAHRYKDRLPTSEADMLRQN